MKSWERSFQAEEMVSAKDTRQEELSMVKNVKEAGVSWGIEAGKR